MTLHFVRKKSVKKRRKNNLKEEGNINKSYNQNISRPVRQRRSYIVLWPSYMIITWVLGPRSANKKCVRICHERSQRRIEHNDRPEGAQRRRCMFVFTVVRVRN